jgi:hypothetical protein
MTLIITAFAQSPDRGAGQARDRRVRWALEEAGQPCDVRLVRSVRRRNRRIARFILSGSGRFRPMKKAISACLSRESYGHRPA